MGSAEYLLKQIVRCQKKRNMGRSNEEVNRPVEAFDRFEDARTLSADDSGPWNGFKGTNPYDFSQLIC